MPISQKYGTISSQLLDYNAQIKEIWFYSNAELNIERLYVLSTDFFNITVPCTPPRGNL